jgi:metal-sulfur cluster biosynthetic enzyme
MMDQDVIRSLEGIVDPELGIDIVDLGLIYRAEHRTTGIEVVMTMTSPSCPMSEFLMAQVNDALHRRFPDSAVHVTLTWSPPWSPARVNDTIRQRLGWNSTSAQRRKAGSWRARIFGRLTRH